MKTMPTLLTLVALLGASFAVGQRSPSRTPPPGSDNNDPPAVAAWKRCQPRAERIPEAVYAGCAFQISGLFAGIDAAEDTKDIRSICFPKKSPVFSGPDEMWSIFGKYVEANLKNLDDHIGRVAYKAFLAAYPCKK